MTDFLTLAEEIGESISRDWQKHCFSEPMLGTCAKAILERVCFPDVTFATLLNELLGAQQLPEQIDLNADFGQPPVVIYRHPKFFIQLLFWRNATPTVHQHSFSGAFCVLLGSILHCIYKFECSQALSAHFKIGQVTLVNADLLGRGDLRLISPGSQFIHSTTHLDRPTITLIIRTYRDSGLTQFAYQRPHLCFDPFALDGTEVRKRQLLEAAFEVGEPLVFKSLAKYKSISPVIVFEYLKGAYLQFGKETSEWVIAKGIAEGIVGPNIDALERCLDFMHRENDVRLLRQEFWDHDCRLFLAMILDGMAIDMAEKLVAAFRPGRPYEEWISECESRLSGNATGKRFLQSCDSLFGHREAAYFSNATASIGSFSGSHTV